MKGTYRILLIDSFCIVFIVALVIKGFLSSFFGVKYGWLIGLPLGVVVGLFHFFKWKKERQL